MATGRASKRGNAGGVRVTKSRSAKQATRRARRLADPRVKAALEEAAALNAALDATMAEQEGEVSARKCADGEHSSAVVISGRHACCGRLAVEPEPEPETVVVSPAIVCGSTCGHDHDSPNGPSGCCEKHGPYLYYCWECHQERKPSDKPSKPSELRGSSDLPGSNPSRLRGPKQPSVPVEGDGNGTWTLGQARSMLMQGYLLAHVVRVTGWGAKWFDDIPLRDGRGVSRDEWLETL